jgi:hypothetical protein
MLALSLVEVVSFAAIASTIISIVSLFCVLYFRKSKTSYNEEMRRVEMDVMRSSFEQKIYDLTQRMQKNPERWRDVNHLIMEGNAAHSFDHSKAQQNSGKPVLDPFCFLEELGIDINELEIKGDQVFVLTPFHPMYEDTYGTIKRACAMNDLIAVRGDESFKTGNILKHVIEQIIISPYIVANINGRNPNVHYELGIAHSFGKDVLLVSEGVDGVAFNLQGERIMIYSDHKDLTNKLYVHYTKLLGKRRDK